MTNAVRNGMFKNFTACQFAGFFCFTGFPFMKEKSNTVLPL